MASVAQDDWDEKLPAVELAINIVTRRSLGKGVSPFMLSHAREPRLPFNLDLPVKSLVVDADGNFAAAPRKSDSKVPRAQQMFGHLSALIYVVREALHTSVNRMKLQADKGRLDVECQVGQSVLLSTKYLRRRMCLGNKAIAPKLMPRYIGPYKVLKRVGSLAYHLNLEGLACHPEFHVSLLQEYKSSGSYQPPMPYVLDGDIVFDVERILDHRFEKRGRAAPKLQYLVKWEGYCAEHDRWEPEVNLRDAPEPLALYAKFLRANGQTLTPPKKTPALPLPPKSRSPPERAPMRSGSNQRLRGSRSGAKRR